MTNEPIIQESETVETPTTLETATETIKDPIYKHKDGRIITKSQLLKDGLDETRIKNGLDNKIITQIGDTDDPEQQFKHKDGRVVSVKQMLEDGLTSERISKGIEMGMITPLEKKNQVASTTTSENLPVGASLSTTNIPTVPLDKEGKGVPAPQNPIDYSKNIIELEDKGDDASKAQAKKYRDDLKAQGYDPDKLNDDFKDIDDWVFQQEGATTSKESLLNEYKENPQQYQNDIANLKFTSLQAKAVQALPPEERVNFQEISVTGNTPEEKRANAREIVKKIQMYGGDYEDALLKNFATIVGKNYAESLNNPEELKKDPRSKFLNEYQIAALQFLEDTNPKAANSYGAMLVDPKLIKKGSLEEAGYQEKASSLEEIGLQLNKSNLSAQAADINRRAQEGQLSQADLQYAQELQNKIEDNDKKIAEINIKYPLPAEREAKEAAMDLTNNSNSTWYNRAFLSVGKALDNTISGIWDFASEPFRNDEESRLYQLATIGESAGEEINTYLPKQRQAIQSYKWSLSPEVKQKYLQVMNNKSLSDDEKTQKVYQIFQSNPDGFTRVPYKETKVNINPSTVYYGVTDLASSLLPYVMLETATGGGATAGVARKILSSFSAAAITGFHDNYVAAIREGAKNPYSQALVTTGIMSAAMAGAGTPQMIKSMIGTKTAVGKLVSKLSDAEIQKTLDKIENGTLKSSLIDFGKQFGKDAVKSIAEGAKGGLKFETIMAGAKALDKKLKGEKIDKKELAKEGGIGVLNFTVFGGVTGIGKAYWKGLTDIQGGTLLQASENPSEYLAAAQKSLIDGTISKTDYEQIKNNIELATKVGENLKYVDDKGKNLSEQRKAYLLLAKMQEAKLNEEKEGDIPEKLRENLDNQINEVQQDIQEIQTSEEEAKPEIKEGEQIYKVEYADPQTGKRTFKIFKNKEEGDKFQDTVGGASQGYYEKYDGKEEISTLETPAVAEKPVIEGVDTEVIQKQMKPFTDKMVEIERDFKNQGYDIDWDYDNEIQILDKDGEQVDPEDLPEDLLDLAGQYEKATQKLGEFDQKSFIKALEDSRKVEEVAAEEVKPETKELPEVIEDKKADIERRKRLSNAVIDYVWKRLAKQGITNADSIIGTRDTIENVDFDKFWKNVIPQDLQDLKDFYIQEKEKQLASFEKYKGGFDSTSGTFTNNDTSFYDNKIKDVDAELAVLEAQPEGTEAKKAEIERLRAKEQAELDSRIPNAEKYRVNGKVDRSKLINEEDRKVFDEVYDKYDKLISPLLEEKPKATEVKEEEVIPMEGEEEQPPFFTGGRTIVTRTGLTEEGRQKLIAQRNRETNVTERSKEEQDILNDIKSYNSLKEGRLGKLKPEGLAKLNKIRLKISSFNEKHGTDYEFNSKRGVLLNDNNRAVKSKTVEGRENEIDESGKVLRDRSQKTQEIFDDLIEQGAIPTGYRADGVRMSETQLNNTIQDILDGVPSIRANNYLNKLEDMIAKDNFDFSTSDVVSQMEATIPLENVLSISKEVRGEPMSEEALNKWLETESERTPENEELYDNIDNLISEYETRNELEGEVRPTPTETEKGTAKQTEQVTEKKEPIGKPEPKKPTAKEGDVITIKTADGEKEGTKIVIPGFEDIDFVATKEGMVYEIRELASGLKVAQSNAFTLEGAISDVRDALMSKNITAEKLYSKIKNASQVGGDATLRAKNKSEAYESYITSEKEKESKKPYVHTEAERNKLLDIAKTAEKEGLDSLKNIVESAANRKSGEKLSIEAAKERLETARENKKIEDLKSENKPLPNKNKEKLSDSEEDFKKRVNEEYTTDKYSSIPESIRKAAYEAYKKYIAIHNEYGYFPKSLKTKLEETPLDLSIALTRYIKGANAREVSSRPERIKEAEAKINEVIDKINGIYEKELGAERKEKAKPGPKPKEKEPVVLPESAKSKLERFKKKEAQTEEKVEALVPSKKIQAEEVATEKETEKIIKDLAKDFYDGKEMGGKEIKDGIFISSNKKTHADISILVKPVEGQSKEEFTTSVKKWGEKNGLEFKDITFDKSSNADRINFTTLKEEEPTAAGEKPETPLFSFEEKRSEDLKDMTDAVLDIIKENPEKPLKEVQADVAEFTGDNSQEMRVLVSGAYKEAKNIATAEIVKDPVLRRLNRAFLEIETTILDNEQELLAKAKQLSGSRFSAIVQPRMTPIEFSKNLEKQYGVTVDLLGNLESGDLTLSKIEVPKELRSTGIGTKVMEDIINYADNNGKRIVLTPSTDFGATSVGRLKDFYSKFDFVENKGANKDFSTKESMYRNPQIPKQTFAEKDKTAGFETRDGKPIGFTYDTDKLARERFDLSKLKQIGAGSDRIVFDLGDGKVLKVAKSPRGLEQNIHEGDPYLTHIMPEVFERGLNYVVSEKVEPLKMSDKVPIYDVETGEQIGTATAREMMSDLGKFSQKDFDNHDSKLQDVLSKYGFQDFLSYDVLYGDMPRIKNWGIRDGQPVHLDGGTLGGVQMVREFRGKAPLSDAEFRKIYEDSKKLKKQFQDTDKYTKFHYNDKGEILGFTHDGKIYLNGEKITAKTTMEEAGHIWVNHMKETNKELYQAGLDKVKGSSYLSKVMNSEFYQREALKQGAKGTKAYNDYMNEEALAKAIADEGAKFATETQKADFKRWVMNMWRNVIKAFGLQDMTPEEVSKLSLKDFARKAAADVFMREKRAEERKVAIEEVKQKEKELTEVPKLTDNRFLYEGTTSQKTRGFFKHLEEAEGVSQSTKDAFKNAGTTKYKVANNEEARLVAADVITAFGKEDALNMARRNDILHPSVRSAIYAELINDAYSRELRAKTADEKAAAATEWKDLSKEYAEQLTAGGQFTAYAGHFYGQSPMGFVMRENEATQERFNEWMENKEDDYKTLYDNLVAAINAGEFAKTPEEKKFQEATQNKSKEQIQAEADRLYNELPKEKKSIANRALEALDKLQQKIRNKSYSDATGMVALIDSGITTIKTAIKAGIAVSKAIEMGIDEIRNAYEKTFNKKWEKEDEFRTDMYEGFKEEKVDSEPEKGTETALRKRIADLKKQIETLREKIDRGGEPGKQKEKKFSDNPEVQKLIEERDKLKKENEELQKKAGVGKYSDESKIEAAKKASQKNIEELERKLADNDLEIKKKTSPTDAELESFKAKQRQLRKEIENKRKEQQVGRYSAQERAEQEVKRKQARINELNRRINERDFSTEEYKFKKEKTLLDQELSEAQRRYNEAKKSSPEYVEKKAKQFLDQFKDRLAGMSAEKKQELVRRYIKRIVESGGLTRPEYQEFKDMVADVMGFKDLTPNQVNRVEDLTAIVNAVEGIEQEMVNNPNPTTIAAYEKAKKEALVAGLELSNMVHKESDAIGTFRSFLTAGLLGLPTLIKNPAGNTIMQALARTPISAVVAGMEYPVYWASLLANKFNGSKILTPSKSILLAQKGYFGKFKSGAEMAAFNFMKGTQIRDYLSTTSYQSNLSPKEAFKNLQMFKKGEIYLTKPEVADNLIKATLGWQPNLILKAMGAGDTPFRWAAEGATALQIATKEMGLKDNNQIDAFMLSPEKMAYKIFRERGVPEDNAAKRAAEIKERILYNGRRAVFEEDNYLTQFSGMIDSWLAKNPDKQAQIIKKGASIAKTFTFPFVKIPSNMAWFGVKLMSPELSIMWGIKQGAEAVNYARKGDFANARKYSELSKYSLATAVVGYGFAAAATYLLSNNLVRTSNDKDTKVREALGEKVYGKQNQINVGSLLGGSDFYIDMNWFGPVGFTMDNRIKIEQQNLQDALKNKPNKYNERLGGFLGNAAESFTTAGAEAMNMTVFDQGAKTLKAISGDENDVKQFLVSSSNTFGNVFTGATFTTISKAMLPYYPRLRGDGIMEEIKNNYTYRNGLVRWAAGQPPARISIWGEPMKQDNSLKGILYNFLGFEEGSKTKFGSILYDDFEASQDPRFFPPQEDNKLTVNGKEVEMPQSDKDKLEMEIGKIRKNFVSAFVYDSAVLPKVPQFERDEEGVLTTKSNEEKKYTDMNLTERAEALSIIWEKAKEIGYEQFKNKNPQYKDARLTSEEIKKKVYKQVDKKIFEIRLEQFNKALNKPNN